jgi:hypothetical protein
MKELMRRQTKRLCTPKYDHAAVNDGVKDLNLKLRMMPAGARPLEGVLT